MRVTRTCWSGGLALGLFALAPPHPASAATNTSAPNRVPWNRDSEFRMREVSSSEFEAALGGDALSGLALRARTDGGRRGSAASPAVCGERSTLSFVARGGLSCDSKNREEATHGERGRW